MDPVSYLKGVNPGLFEKVFQRLIRQPLNNGLSKIYSGNSYQNAAWEELLSKSRNDDGTDSKQAFLHFAMALYRLSKAQLFQDLWVLWETKLKRGGYFVEFGATDGVTLSNSYVLEKHFEWGGLLAEPFTYWHSSLERNRTARIDRRCVWKRSGEMIEFLATDAMPELAGIEVSGLDDPHRATRRAIQRQIMVETISLDDLLKQHSAPEQIDYLSIDTEGSEFEILSAFDFSRYRVSLISVEHNFNGKKREGIRKILCGEGFVRVFEEYSLWDDWYINRS